MSLWKTIKKIEKNGYDYRKALQYCEKNYPGEYCLADALAIKDEITSLHLLETMRLVDTFCIYNNIPNREERRTAGLLHDIGKLNTEDEILINSGALSTLQYEKIKNHPEVGRKLLERTGSNNIIIDAAYSHHERLNGSGYPQGLKGNEIPLVARIVAIADTYEALTGKRPYQDPVSSTTALNKLTDSAKKGEYDPEVLEGFKKSLGF